MKTININQIEKVLMVGLAAFATFFAVIFIFINRQNSSLSQIETRPLINYEMVRPSENYSEYDLNGRDIDSSYEAIKRKEQIAKNEVKKASELKKAMNKNEEKIKKSTTNKSATSATQSINQNKKSDGRNSVFSDAKVTPNMNNVSDSAVAANRSAGLAEVLPNKSATQSEVDQNKKTKKTFAEWRQLIFSKPTQDSVNSFIAAYRKGEVTSTEVQTMFQDLLEQDNDTLKGLGLYGLRSTPSLTSYSMLIHTESKLTGAYQSYVQQAYLAYLQPQNVSYLNQALQTKDKVVIVKTLNLLGTYMQSIAKGDLSSLVDPRNRRQNPNVGQVSISSYMVLVPVLNQLQANQESEIASMAQQVASTIQSSNNIASN